VFRCSQLLDERDESQAAVIGDLLHILQRSEAKGTSISSGLKDASLILKIRMNTTLRSVLVRRTDHETDRHFRQRTTMIVDVVAPVPAVAVSRGKLPKRWLWNDESISGAWAQASPYRKSA
jgi:hypothetical protein